MHGLFSRNRNTHQPSNTVVRLGLYSYEFRCCRISLVIITLLLSYCPVDCLHDEEWNLANKPLNQNYILDCTYFRSFKFCKVGHNFHLDHCCVVVLQTLPLLCSGTWVHRPGAHSRPCPDLTPPRHEKPLLRDRDRRPWGGVPHRNRSGEEGGWL